MGADPKTTKRSKQTTAQSNKVLRLPMRASGGGGTCNNDSVPHHQSRLPQSSVHEREVIIPGLHNALELLAGNDPDGYLKATLGDEGKSWFVAWRFQRGPWAGHYVMVRVLRGELSWGLQLLQDKVEGVRAGTRKPTRDRYGD